MKKDSHPKHCQYGPAINLLPTILVTSRPTPTTSGARAQTFFSSIFEVVPSSQKQINQASFFFFFDSFVYEGIFDAIKLLETQSKLSYKPSAKLFFLLDSCKIKSMSFGDFFALWTQTDRKFKFWPMGSSKHISHDVYDV